MKITRYRTRGYFLRMSNAECCCCDGDGKYLSNGYYFGDAGELTIVKEEVDKWLPCPACKGTGRQINEDGSYLYWNDIKTIPEKYLKDDYDLEADRPI